MKRTHACLAAALLLTAAAACGTTVQGDGTPRRNPDLIRAEEIRETTDSDAYELVQRLRPTWLRKRGASSIYNEGDILVYYDQVRMGGPEALRQIPANAVGSMRFLNAASATQRWGTGHAHGAILVLTTTGRSGR